MLEALCVGIGGFFGALFRYWISSAVAAMPIAAGFPWGTLVVNILGCFLLGAIGEVGSQFQLSTQSRLMFVVGGLGSLTTFSTFGLDTIRLRQEVGAASAYINIVMQLACGFFAVWLGLFVVKLLIGSSPTH